MYTSYTYEDWSKAPEDKREILKTIIASYRASEDFKRALLAQQYFISDNAEIKNKYIVQFDSHEVTEVKKDPLTGEEIPVTGMISNKVKVAGTRITSSFLFRFVTQQNQHLLGNGVTLTDEALKKKLGRAFDTALASMGEKALLDGVCWGFWNNDHLEIIRAASDNQSGAVALLGEADGQPKVFIQFWRLAKDKPMHVRVFEPDGFTMYAENENKDLYISREKAPYKNVVLRDAGGESVIGGANYNGVLPVVPLYANPEKRSELTDSIKSKIDCFDRVSSDFGDNLQMANDIFWVLNNFGGSAKEVLKTLQQIKELRAVVNISDGMGGGSTAEPHTFEVPYNARQVALDILRVELYNDYMALDNKSLTGSSLANSAIKAAVMDLNLKCDRYEWQVFDFVQNVLSLIGVQTEDISFKRRSYENESEIIENIYRAAEDLDRETRLKLNPMIPNDSIPQILANKDAEQTTGMASVEQLQAEIDRMRQEEGNGAGQGRQTQ